MGAYHALCIGSTRAGTRVNALLTHAGLVERTVRGRDALGPAGDGRVAEVVGRTRAHGHTVDGAARREQAAGVREARVTHQWRRWWP